MKLRPLNAVLRLSSIEGGWLVTLADATGFTLGSIEIQGGVEPPYHQIVVAVGELVANAAEASAS